jgi:hypothetical protein
VAFGIVVDRLDGVDAWVLEDDIETVLEGRDNRLTLPVVLNRDDIVLMGVKGLADAVSVQVELLTALHLFVPVGSQVHALSIK